MEKGKRFKTLYIVKDRDLRDTDSVELNNIFTAYHRGHDVHIVYPQDFFVKDRELYVIARQPNAARINSLETYLSFVQKPEFMLDRRIPVGEFDIIFSRIVPRSRDEFLGDDNVIKYLQCVKALHPEIAFINDPDSIDKAGSKIYDSLVLRDVLPVTHITKDEVRIREILKKGEWIAKPVHGFGGTGVIGINRADLKKNLNALIQLLLRDLYSSTNEPRPFILQERLEGLERRLVLLDGSEIIAAYGKSHAEDDMRGNSSAGSTYFDYEPRGVDLEIVDRIAPVLKNEGLYLVALDIMGPESNASLKNTKMLELNVRCPQWSKGIKDRVKLDEISDKIIAFSEELSNDRRR